MKKLLKGIVSMASVAAIAAGVYYVAKKWMDEKDEELDDDIDDCDYEEESDSREYVTLDIEDEDETDDTQEETVAEEDISETQSAADYESVPTDPTTEE